MKASELRICNLIFTHKEEIIVVKGIDIEGLILFNEDQNIFDFKCKPIPLTEEWLVKFGFENEGFDYWNGPVFFELCDCGNGEWRNSINCHEYEHGIAIKYVHQLQNLYFALTGEELQLIEKAKTLL